MKNLTIIVGIPCSGKTTWVNKNKGTKFVLSADLVRKHLHGKSFYEEAEQMVWTLRRYIFLHALEQGIDIIVDETSITAKKRAEILKFANIYGYTCDCVFIRCDKKICETRCVKIKTLETLAKIPIINRMARQLEAPSSKEGFINIIEIENSQ
jgi:predicted kinase